MRASSLFTPILALLVAAIPGTAVAEREKAGESRASSARAMEERGDFEGAVGEWRIAAREFGKAKDTDAEAGALLGEAGG